LLGAVDRSAVLKLEYFKQFLDQLRISGGGDDRVHPVPKLHQANPALVVHRQADNSLQGRSPGIVQSDFDVSRNEFAVIRSRLLQLNPSPEESTSSRPEPPLETKHSCSRAPGYNFWVTMGGIKVLPAGNGRTAGGLSQAGPWPPGAVKQPAQLLGVTLSPFES
jgi:hypothetical protein